MPGQPSRSLGQRTRSACRLRATTIFASLALLAGLVAAPPVAAAPITRYVGPGGGPGACSAPAYATIQPAVIAASAGDTIHICSGTYTLGATVTVGVDLTFVGDGAATTILDGASTYRILDAEAQTISLSGLTLRNGNSGGNAGGAISADVLTVNDSTFTGNVAAFGGAIYAGTATITDSTFEWNRATSATGGGGGVIYSANSVTVTGSTFVGNAATDFAGTGYGGAISAFGAVSVANSTFFGNHADTAGGGIYARGTPVAVTNSTFSANTAADGGTIRANGSATFTNSILAHPSAVNNCSGPWIVDGGGNLSTDASCNFTAGASHDDVAIADLALGALADNGGPTETMAIGAGSLATDEGLDAACAAAPVNGKDQRGVARPLGPHCDAGAYEAPAPVPAVTAVSPTSGPVAGGTIVTITGSGFDGASAVHFGATTATGVTVDSSTAITATSPAGSGTVDVTVTTPGGTSPTSSADRFSFTRTRYVVLSPTASGGGSCAAPDYNTIADAVAAAGTGDTIHICAGTYNLGATIIVPVDLAFVGDGAATTIVDGASTYRILDASARTISLSGLTLRNGGVASAFAVSAANAAVADCTFSGNNGGIFAPGGALTVTNSTFTGNSATGTNLTSGGGGSGGAIYAGSVTVEGSTFSGNSAHGWPVIGGGLGGAIMADTVSVTGSTFTANTATVATGGGKGGAIYATTVTVTDSTFAGNTATYDGGDAIGGAIGTAYAAGGGGVTVTYSTFSANSATVGGAIDANGPLVVTNSTFSANSATVGGALYDGQASIAVTNSTFSGNTATSRGGAIAGVRPVYEVTVTNSILAQPSASNNCAGGMIGNSVSDGGGNFSTDASCGFTLPASHNSVAIASLALGSLASNGGPTATIALGAGSVAIDAGLDAVCAAYPVSGLDQRGVTRPQGAHCDSGAYEAPAHPVSYPAVIRAGVWYLRDSNTSTPGTITAFAYGAPSDVPVFGDWDGDGTKTPGVVRVTGGSLTWYLRNSNSSGAPDLVFTWGAATDRPLVGDWNGDGVDSIGLLRGNWWLLRNSNSIGAPDIDFFWGLAADTPLVGDWNGDGIDSPGWLRCLGVSCTPGTGNWWLLRNSNSGGATDLDFFWGRTTENAWVTGDWDGDGTDNPGILRGEWWLLRAANSDGAPTSDFFYGLPSDTFRVWAQ